MSVPSYRLFRFLRKLGVQSMLNWTARVPRQEGAQIAVPLLGNLGGELLGELAGRSYSHECEYLFLPGERADTLRSAFSV